MSGKPRTFVEIGQRFGYLTVIEPETSRTCVTPNYKWGCRSALCECECGNRVAVAIKSLRTGGTVSCGCRRRELLREDFRARTIARLTTHGLTHHPLFATWKGMMARCYNPKATGYHNYGGRGIAVCEEWHDVRRFIAWTEANLGPRARGMTIDREQVNGNYDPGNVRWATKSEQRRNQRPRVRVA
jgi:hypothetical protein